MFRSALVWTLTAAFLVTIPVTGAGRCPCRFVKALRPPTPGSTAGTTVPSQNRKCCCQSRHDAPERSNGNRPKPPQGPSQPTDAPCECHAEAVALPGTPGERSGSARGAWDADLLAEVGVELTSHVEGGPLTPFGPAPAPRPGAHLFRYAHAFRS